MSDESFAALFESQANARPGHRKVQVGEMLEGVVVQVSKDTIFVELDGKRQAMLDVAEMRSPDGSLAIAVGDTVRAKVVEVDATTDQVRLGRSFGKSGDIAQIEQAHAAAIPVEGKVTGVNKGGIDVDLGRGTRGFCPMSQIALRGAADAGALVGQLLEFQVTEIKDGGRNIVLSRRKLLEAAAREGREAVLRTLETGKVVRGTVSAVREFGAFVDLGGIEGLIPASEISHERGVAVADRITAGESVEVQVLEIKDDDKGQKRITLSLKSLAPAPALAEKARANVAIGSIVRGQVVRIESYGVFVQIEGTEGRAGRGLIPSAELGVPRGMDLRKAFHEGMELVAKVLETGDGRLKLSVRGAKDAAERAEFEAHKDKAAAPASLGTFGDLLNKSQSKKAKR